MPLTSKVSVRPTTIRIPFRTVPLCSQPSGYEQRGAAHYLISVLDDFSRFILAWDLKAEQTAEAMRTVVQQAVEWTGMPAAPVESRARLLTERGPGYLAAAFKDYLRALGIRHIYCGPHHPQTNGKLERFHETLRARLNLLVYTSPEVLRAAMADFIRIYNHERYH